MITDSGSVENKINDKRAWSIRPAEREDAAHLGKLTTITYGDMWKRAGDAAYYDWKMYRDKAPPRTRFRRCGR
ncbi:hypothetical protein H8D51_04390 [bacterium]|nr:hypothetical protein [bacterium]